ncbi:hypothetical protein DLAC_10200 [Tieghemostelium lacteum]|uniref:F-box domain-containing protein n=1 Tax=Tieghemostelium lacteum TaxID=361077 RepID=A0A151Z4V2_TIELA|nr:hypothetical protein DLAC_10200 [Tieghemostelium lacteum]|eukprot:KYQ88986.1 hypothetical protein DLAC_10200 [Tieghemostelium lacteum]
MLITQILKFFNIHSKKTSNGGCRSTMTMSLDIGDGKASICYSDTDCRMFDEDTAQPKFLQNFEYFLHLSDELKLLVLSFLSHGDLLVLARCCKLMNWLSNDRSLWLGLCHSHQWQVPTSVNYKLYYHDKLSSLKTKVDFKPILKSKGKLPSSRYKHTSTRVGDLIVYIGGQVSDQKRFNDVIHYDTKLNKFTRPKVLGDKVPNFSRHTARAVGNKIWVFGGYSGRGQFYDLQCYDPKLNLWEQVTNVTGDIPKSRTNHASTTWGDYLYIFGGNSIQQGEYEILSDMHRINTKTLQWEKVQFTCDAGDIPSERCGHCLETINDKIYLFGGGRWDGQWMKRHNDIYIFDPVTCHWSKPKISERSSPPETSTFSVSFVYGRFLYLFGGGNPKLNMVTNTLYQYDTVLNSWEKLNYTPNSDIKPRDMSAASLIDDTIFIFGGFAGGPIGLLDKINLNYRPLLQ